MKQDFELTVETCVGGWQSILVPVVFVDVEHGEAIHAFKLSESVERHLASSGDKLE